MVRELQAEGMTQKMQSQDLIVRQGRFEYFRRRNTEKRPDRIIKLFHTRTLELPC